MQVYSPTIPITKEYNSESARVSLPILLPTPAQSPSMYMNKREERRNYRHINQDRLGIPHYEIDFLTEKLISAEEKVYKWKKEFKDLHIKFMQISTENTKIRQELDITRRMLEESEHIRSRWFIKRPQEIIETNENIKKSPPQHQSLPNNLLRFLKLNSKKPLP